MKSFKVLPSLFNLAEQNLKCNLRETTSLLTKYTKRITLFVFFFTIWQQLLWKVKVLKIEREKFPLYDSFTAWTNDIKIWVDLLLTLVKWLRNLNNSFDITSEQSPPPFLSSTFHPLPLLCGKNTKLNEKVFFLKMKMFFFIVATYKLLSSVFKTVSKAI